MKLLCVLSLLLLSLPVLSKDIKTVEAEYVYYAPENMTIEEAKRTAVERAKIQAIADAFGTIVSQTNTTRVENSNGKSSVDFLSIGGSDVKGEWIETIGEPSISVSYDKNVLVIKVYIKGRAREITTSSIDIQTHILCNGIDEKSMSTAFKNGDDLYLSFLSPVSGYLSVYLVDSENVAYCLLPYRNQTDGIYKVEANRQYIFFKESEAPERERAMVDEYTMTCSRSLEQNNIYVLFSPNLYTKASDRFSEESLPRELTFEKFQKWLQNAKKRDVAFQSQVYTIQISN